MSELIYKGDVLGVISCFFKDNDIDGLADLEREINRLDSFSPWHRVEEEPKDEGKYLVCDGRGNYYVAWWGKRLGWCYNPKFFCYWMPIEPPKEVQE